MLYKIAKLPLVDIPAESLVGLEIPQLVDRIIIGPARDAVTLKHAFEQLLFEAGMKDASLRVCVSDIPLRY